MGSAALLGVGVLGAGRLLSAGVEGAAGAPRGSAIASPASAPAVATEVAVAPEGRRMAMEILDVEVGPEQEGYLPVRLATSRGDVECRHYPAAGATRAAVWVPGAIGGWHSPALGLYPRLAEEFKGDGIASLQVRYRQPANLAESVLDVLAGLAYLEAAGVEAVSLTGHSFGGAVVIQAAAASPLARTVVALSTQGYGADPVTALAPRCSILLVHGTADEILAPRNAEYVYQLAGEPKRLVLLEGARHGLDEAAEEVYRVIGGWIRAELGDGGREQATPTG